MVREIMRIAVEELDTPEAEAASTAAHDYAHAAHPIDPEMGWRRDDIELAFVAGSEWRALQND